MFKALLDQEVRAKTVMVDGPFLHASHSLTLDARDEALWTKISAELARERFKPPRVRATLAGAHSVPEPEMRKLLQRAWPRSGGSSKWRPTSISCVPWWPR